MVAGDLWYFPAGLPHSLQGLGPDGAEFVIVFDNGMASEFNTLMLTDWIAHTPPEVLAKNFGVPADTFKNIPLSNLWIFQGKEPPALADDQAAVVSKLGEPALDMAFPMSTMAPTATTRSGEVKIVDSRNFPISKTIAVAHGDGEARRHARHALASECGRVAVLHQGRSAHDGLQHRSEGADRRLPPRRHRLS